MPRNRIPQQKIDQMKTLRAKGMSYGKISKIVGIHKSLIHYHCKIKPDRISIPTKRKKRKRRDGKERNQYICLAEDCSKEFKSLLGIKDAICLKCGSSNITKK